VAEKHPYISGSGSITQVIAQLRHSFPATVNAETLKKLGIAPNNETYVLNILRFLNILDAEGKKIPAAATVMNKHADEEFEEAFSALVKQAYHQLFELHQEKSWSLTRDKLITFFRNTDGTSGIVGERQAGTFQALARLAGKVAEGAQSVPKAKAGNGSSRTAKTALKKGRASTATPAPQPAPEPPPVGHIAAPPSASHASGTPMALTVRIEINLPAGGDQQTYDYIFKSIRENLLNGNA
jgi:hypothetical protein